MYHHYHHKNADQAAIANAEKQKALPPMNHEQFKIKLPDDVGYDSDKNSILSHEFRAQDQFVPPAKVPPLEPETINLLSQVLQKSIKVPYNT